MVIRAIALYLFRTDVRVDVQLRQFCRARGETPESRGQYVRVLVRRSVPFVVPPGWVYLCCLTDPGPNSGSADDPLPVSWERGIRGPPCRQDADLGGPARQVEMGGKRSCGRGRSSLRQSNTANYGGAPGNRCAVPFWAFSVRFLS